MFFGRNLPSMEGSTNIVVGNDCGKTSEVHHRAIKYVCFNTRKAITKWYWLFKMRMHMLSGKLHKKERAVQKRLRHFWKFFVVQPPALRNSESEIQFRPDCASAGLRDTPRHRWRSIYR